MKTVAALIVSVATICFSAKPAKKTQSLLGKETFALPQRVIIQDSAKAKAAKAENPMLAMAGFKLKFIGLAEVQLDVYKAGSNFEGEISTTSLQMPGLMGPVDRRSTKTAKLENIRITSDTLWFLYSSQTSSEPSKGFLTYSSGKKILGIPAANAYRIPCKEQLPGYFGLDEKFYTTTPAEPMYPVKKDRLNEFRSCLDTLNLNADELRVWKGEISDAKFVIDSLLQ